MPATPAQLAAVKEFLPADAADNGWTDEVVTDRWAGGVPSTVRAYWYDRVTQTAGYIDLSDSSGSLPITQIYRQAKEMLDYWDAWITKYGNSLTLSRNVSIGKIRNRYPRPRGARPLGPNSYSPYAST